MTENYTLGQVVKGKEPPRECPPGMYWRKAMGRDEFRLYIKKERRKAGLGPVVEGRLKGEPKLTVKRVAEGIRAYMQDEAGFRRVMDIAQLTTIEIGNLAKWSGTIANERLAIERTKAAAFSQANEALRKVGLKIGSDKTIQPILPNSNEQNGSTR